MKNASFFYFDITNKAFTWNNKFYSTSKIQPCFHAKGGFGNISVLQKIQKSYRLQIRTTPGWSLELVHLSGSGPWTIRVMKLSLPDISTMTERQRTFITDICKHWKESKIRYTKEFFEDMRGVWNCDKTSSRVTELLPQWKLKLRKTTEKLLYVQSVLFQGTSPKATHFKLM